MSSGKSLAARVVDLLGIDRYYTCLEMYLSWLSRRPFYVHYAEWTTRTRPNVVRRHPLIFARHSMTPVVSDLLPAPNCVSSDSSTVTNGVINTSTDDGDFDGISFPFPRRADLTSLLPSPSWC